MGVHRRGANEADARCVECWQAWPCPSAPPVEGEVVEHHRDDPGPVPPRPAPLSAVDLWIIDHPEVLD